MAATSIPMNAVAEQVIAAISTANDIVQQISELQAALQRQQGIVNAMMPLAIWGEEPETPVDPDGSPPPEEPIE